MTTSNVKSRRCRCFALRSIPSAIRRRTCEARETPLNFIIYNFFVIVFFLFLYLNLQLFIKLDYGLHLSKRRWLLR